jgi:DNA-binding SARP family transcriptional activator
VEVQLLGAVEVRRDGTRVDLRGELARALVAYLALSAGASRSIDDIVDALWPHTADTIPANPRQAVHTHASRTRQLLGTDVLVARSGG